MPHTKYTPQFKTRIFVLEGLNALAASLYLNYLFFYMRHEFGFTNVGNLCLGSVNGFTYAVAAWACGKFAQRYGYMLSLRIGFVGSAVSLVAASVLHSVPGQYSTMVLWTIGMCFIWPAMEGVLSENEPRERLQRHVGIYNIVWASGAGLAYFLGGALLEKLGPRSIFFVPALVHVAQFMILGRRSHASVPAGDRAPNGAATASSEPSPQAARDNARPLHAAEVARDRVPGGITRPSPRTFLTMAWVANPFAYVAINSILPVIPRLAERLQLSPMLAGFVCSVWFFARVAAFVGLWLWPGWHYRFRWLATAYAAMLACFALILVAPNLWVLVLVQIVFGVAIGLIYYSSLFYSMDVGDTKGEHGGFHEAALGFGLGLGPGVAAGSLCLFPAQLNVNTWAVTLLLAGGLAWLLILRWGRDHATHTERR